jgi:hypothetical protein
MDIDAMLCDHAETAEGKLFINGAAISLLWVAPQPPHVINLGVAAVVHVPYTDTNQPHQIRVTLEDGDPVVPWSPEGSPSPDAVEITGDFNVGRPPTLSPGESQALPFAFQMTGLPMPRLGLHSVVVEIDGVERRRLSFRVLVQNS